MFINSWNNFGKVERFLYKFMPQGCESFKNGYTKQLTSTEF